MRRGDPARRGGPASPCGLRALVVLLALAAIPSPRALAAEWEAVRAQQRDALRAAGARVAEIEAREGGGAADREKAAEQITRDRIARARVLLKSGETSIEPRAEDGARLAAVERAWGPNGAERRKLAESRADFQRDLDVADAKLEAAIEALEATAARLPQLDMPAALARVEAALGEAGERLSARWQREHAAREREREQRERELGQRERGVR